MNRKKVVSIVILSGLALLNTGCIQKYFYDNKNIEKKVEYKDIKPVTTNSNPNSNPNIACDEAGTPKDSDCDIGAISANELNHTPKQGEQHILKSIRGKTIHVGEKEKGFTFNEYRGKVVILQMFGKDCPHCINELPVLRKIRKKYRGKLEVIAIQSQERMSKPVASNYINQHKIRYPIVEGEDATNLQYSIQETFGWTGILPYTLVIHDDTVKYIHSGEVSYKDLDRDIGELF
ncbi:TlpA family protein disulfide reductase [Sulfurovum sp. bin170]|uniref:TlpA family protein disulfide reductase n=1 Tax=Sulfurovum sp. bin170 TaxID=2695268 RepID=UPI0013DE8A4A|nr:TlpA disulfide reductase family protein [Sulfurovum sp. bin170]NEW59896.1 TlpA family protein disulfide reductase [Sulfurovum sp. bin170]